MAGQISRKLLIITATAAVVGLGGCEELDFGNSSSNAISNTPPAREARVETREVERPDIFSTQERGLWDGRPSLGGVWVAHPNVSDPERVLIRNTNTGVTVVGALFRRERASAGPALQVSSEAADALGMLAGAPAELTVVALRTEEVVIEPEIPAEIVEPVEIEEVSEAPEEVAAPEDIAETTLDPIASAAAALDASEGVANTATGVAGEIAEELVETPRERRIRLREERRAAREAERQAREAERIAAEEAAAAAQAQAQADEVPEEQATPEIQSTLDKPYIQIGIFSVESNARDAANGLRMQSVMTQIIEGSINGRTFWRVIVGPAENAGERSSLLEQVKEMGYSDAYFVSE